MSKPSYKFSTSVQLEEATQYYVRAYAITAKGTAYGEEKSFVTQDIPETPDDIKGDEIWCSPENIVRGRTVPEMQQPTVLNRISSMICRRPLILHSPVTVSG